MNASHTSSKNTCYVCAELLIPFNLRQIYPSLATLLFAGDLHSFLDREIAPKH
jgi:hypothetical protein